MSASSTPTAPPIVCKWHMPESEWYEGVLAHWTSQVSADDNDGVLGGWAEVDVEDVRGSLKFAAECLGHEGLIKSPVPPHSVALDCGAGVGRVTKGVLVQLADRVHLVEVSDKLLSQAKENLRSHAERIKFERASLRDFTAAPAAYDLVWAQWVLGHLTDTDVVGLLARSREGLRPGGAIVVKDNTALPSDCDVGGTYLLDQENAAVIRSHAHLRSLFKLAGLKMAKTAVQDNFPEDLHPVRMYWLVPA
uniref:Alpha N-terminal protein methyltransferase 1 n=1 Tax=Haptolina brevifila TaxID=156173 RepID=A0A7S2FMT8_9EUKA